MTKGIIILSNQKKGKVIVAENREKIKDETLARTFKNTQQSKMKGDTQICILAGRQAERRRLRTEKNKLKKTKIPGIECQRARQNPPTETASYEPARAYGMNKAKERTTRKR